MQCLCLRIETGLVHPSYPGHVMSGSSRSHLLYKISVVFIGTCELIMGSGHNQIDELSMLEVDGSESPDSPQDWRD